MYVSLTRLEVAKFYMFFNLWLVYIFYKLN